MTQTVKESPKKGVKRRRLRWSIVGALLLLIIFHRPILLCMMEKVAIGIARHEDVALSLTLEGNLFTHLTVRNIHADGRGKSPVRKINVERAHFEYSIVRLLRGGISDFLSSYQLKNASLELEIIPPQDDDPKRASELAKLIRDTLQQPALFTDRVDIENVNLLIHTPQGDFKVTGLGALLDTDAPSFIHVGELVIPKITSWRDLRTEATFQRRNLIVKDFSLGKEIHVSKIEIDSSRRAEGVDFLIFEGELFGGETRFYLWRRAKKSGKAHVQFNVSTRGLSLESLRDFLHWKPEISGTVEHFWVQLSGAPDIPAKWTGDSLLRFKNGIIQKVPIEGAAFQLFLADGVARLAEATVTTGSNRVDLEWEAPLPESMKELFAQGVAPKFTLHAPELAKMHPTLLGGALDGSGQLHIQKGTFNAEFTGTAQGITAQAGALPLGLQSGSLKMEASVLLDEPCPAGASDLHALTVKATGSAKGLRIGPAELDAGSVTLALEKERLLLSHGEVLRGANTARFEGEMLLPIQKEAITENDLSLSFHVNAPSLAELNTSSAHVFNGSLIAEGEFQRKNGKASGLGKIEARDLAFHSFVAKRLSLELPLNDETLKIRGLELQINEKDKLSGEATVSLQKPHLYEGRLAGSIADLTPLAKLAGQPLEGAISIEWHGSGTIATLQHTGEGQLQIAHGRIGSVTGITVDVAGRYSPEVIELSPVRFHSDQGSVDTVISMQNQRLALEPLRIEVAKGGSVAGSVTGHLRLPLDLRTPDRPESILPAGGPIDAELKLTQIDLASFHLLSAKNPTTAAIPAPPTPNKNGVRGPNGRPLPPPTPLGVKGIVNATLVAKGTLPHPDLTLSVKGQGLHLSTAAQLQPATAEITLRFLEDQLSVKGAARLPNISPLEFSGHLPLPLQTTLEQRRIAPTTPLHLDITLPSSSAAFLTQVIPILRYVEGRVGIDAKVRGSLEQPLLSGGAQIDLPAVRFRDTNIPGINGFKGDLQLTGSELQFRRFQGDSSGGLFGVTGKIGLQNLLEPQLDLRFKSQGTLLVRNDSLIVRADSDIRLTGPLAAAEIKGQVGINKSRFFREIDIIPIGLPGKQAPQRAKASSVRPELSIREAPFRDWKLDVVVKTTEPFSIRSNLANGRALADLRIGGTGLAPIVEGTARLENFVASLPFSRLEVEHGIAYFSQGEPFNPMLDIHGTSRIRNHTINVYVYGNAEDPQTLFTSEPPLPQEEIIALLATGATTSEFGQNDQALAGRASMLLLQDLYHRVFKRRTPPPINQEGEPFADRFQLDMGTVDPRSGRQEVGGRFKLSDQFEVGAGLDVEGDVRVQLRYLLRFK